MNYKNRIREINQQLKDLHGEPDDVNPGDGVGQLIATILSQNVSDNNTEQAMSRLRSEYGSNYERIENAPVDELSEVVRPAGFHKTKAERIKLALKVIREHTDGDYTLSFLDDFSTEEAREWLQDIKGVGPKTANVVLSFHFGKPAMPVDTHIHRLSERFGLIPEGCGNQESHDLMNERTPDEIKYEFHVLMIDHGREYCSAQSPDCDNPVCEEFCSCEGC